MDPVTLSAIIGGTTSMLGMAEKNKAKAKKGGGTTEPLQNPIISLFPRGRSLLTMPPIGYQVVGSQGNNIPAAALVSGGGGGGAYMNMNQANMAQTRGDPKLDEPIKDYDPLASGKPSAGQPSTAGQPVDLVDPSSIFGEPPANQQRLPKTEDEMKHEVELQKMSDKNAMIRQGISSAGTFLGTMMRPPSAVTVGGYRPNPALQMFRRRRGLMGG